MKKLTILPILVFSLFSCSVVIEEEEVPGEGIEAHVSADPAQNSGAGLRGVAEKFLVGLNLDRETSIRQVPSVKTLPEALSGVENCRPYDLDAELIGDSCQVEPINPVYSKTAQPSQDVYMVEAFEQIRQTERAKRILMIKYSLSAARAQKIAEIAVALGSNLDSMTSADLNSYFKDVVGVNYNEMVESIEKYKQGDVLPFEAALNDAAYKNGITLENAKKIIGIFM
ncbi:MAG: hypothetical protein V3T17_08510 [Pseudomonadales bacterium]